MQMSGRSSRNDGGTRLKKVQHLAAIAALDAAGLPKAGRQSPRQCKSPMFTHTGCHTSAAVHTSTAPALADECCHGSRAPGLVWVLRGLAPGGAAAPAAVVVGADGREGRVAIDGLRS